MMQNRDIVGFNRIWRKINQRLYGFYFDLSDDSLDDVEREIENLKKYFRKIKNV